jgi:hypothetical protein
MAKSSRSRIHSPAVWEAAADRNRADFDRFRGTDPAAWTEADRLHYIRVCAAQIERLFYMVEAIALETPEKPARPRSPRAPREPKPTARDEINRLGAFILEHYPDEATGNHVDTVIRLLSTEAEPVAQEALEGGDE